MIKELLSAKFHEVCFNQSVEVAIKYGAHISGFEVCPQIFHHAVWLQNVGPDLRTPFNFLFLRFDFCFLLPFFAKLNFIKL